MFFEVFLIILVGFFFGMITGLVPGLHPNTIYMLLLSFLPLFSFLGIIHAILFVVALAVTNTFFDFIPSLIFGAPEEGSELSVLPGHKMLLKGNAHEAILLTAYGGLISTVLIIISFPLMIYLIPLLYEAIGSYVHYIIILIVAWMILTEKYTFKKFWSAAIFIMSGAFGLIVLNLPSSEVYIFPALTGLFGISGLIVSMESGMKMPFQKKASNVKMNWKGPITGWLSGMFVGLLPGIGVSIAGVISGQIMKVKVKEFITALGGINTSNIIFTLIVLYSLGKTRSGLAVFVSNLSNVNITLICITLPVSLICAVLSFVFVPKTGWFILKNLEKFNYSNVSKAIIILLVVLIFIFSGLVGILITVIGSALGYLCIKSGVRRSFMMGFFMLSVIFFYFGV